MSGARHYSSQRYNHFETIIIRSYSEVHLNLGYFQKKIIPKQNAINHIYGLNTMQHQSKLIKK